MMNMFSNPKFLGLLGAVAVVGVAVYFGQMRAPAETILADGSANPLLVQTVLADRAMRPQLDAYEIALTQLQLDSAEVARLSVMIGNTPFASESVAPYDMTQLDLDLNARIAETQTARDDLDTKLANTPQTVLSAADQATAPATRQAAIIAMQHSLCNVFAAGGLPPGCTTKQN